MRTGKRLLAGVCACAILLGTMASLPEEIDLLSRPIPAEAALSDFAEKDTYDKDCVPEEDEPTLSGSCSVSFENVLLSGYEEYYEDPEPEPYYGYERGLKYTVTDGNATITSGKNAVEEWKYADTGEIISVIYIPKTIDGYTVTGISKGAFSGLDVDLLSIDADIPVLTRDMFLGFSATRVTVSGNTNTISSYTFVGEKYNSVFLNDNIQSIGERAFGYHIKYGTDQYDYSYYKNESFTLSCYENSAALDYAKNNDFNYSIIKEFDTSVRDDGTLAVTKYNWNKTNVVIPTEIDGKEVTRIEQNAFYNGENIESISIPKSITSISSRAFQNCSNLLSYNVDKNNKVYSSVDGILYDKKITRLIRCPKGKKDVTIPNSVTRIGKYAFESCSFIESILIPKNVTSMGDGAFHNCYNLKSIDISDGITCIEYDTFCDCSSLENVVLPDSIETIGDYAFGYCSNLKSITVPNSVIRIRPFAFCDCSNLKSITLPESVKFINMGVFDYCSDLESITVKNKDVSIGAWAFEETKWMSDQQEKDGFAIINGILVNGKACSGEVTVPDGVKRIGGYAFSGCEELTKITIPSSVEKIDFDAFDNCKNLTTVIIQNGATAIGDSAFNECSSLSSITIPDSVAELGNNVFNGCTSLTDITLPNSVCGIGETVFSKCINLENIKFSENLTKIGKNAFSDTKWLESRRKENPLVIEKGILVDGQTCEGDIEIPDRVKVIGGYSFSGNTALTSISIPNSVVMIGEGAFEECTKITEVVVPDSVISIGNGVFYQCTALKTVKLSDNLVSLGERSDHNFVLSHPDYDWSPRYYGVFEGCWSLTGVEIPGTVRTIGDNAFNQTRIDNLSIPESVVEIGYEAISSCWNLKELIIPNSVKEIDGYAFSNCGNLTGVTMPNSIKTISKNTFSYSDKLDNVVIPDSVTSIEDGAFRECTGLNSITIPESVEQIGKDAFFKCTSLNTITIPKSVVKIGEYAFGYIDSVWNSDESFDEYTKSDDFVICCYADTAGEQYAKDNGFRYVLLDGKDGPDTLTGTVSVCAKDSEDLSDIVITAVDTAGAVFNVALNEDGSFASALPSGNYTVTVKKKGYPAMIQEITVRQDSPLSLNLELYQYGDSNKDSKVNLKDLVLLKRHLNKWGIEILLSVCDLNNDGKVNLKDLVLLQRYLNKWNIVFE